MDLFIQLLSYDNFKNRFMMSDKIALNMQINFFWTSSWTCCKIIQSYLVIWFYLSSLMVEFISYFYYLLSIGF